jgi:hypothetical protein
VHRAALAFARAALLAVDFLHHRDHVHALGDAVAVTAVRAGDAVAVAQVHHDPGARGLLAGIQVDEAGDVASREVDVQPLLELADRAHRAVGLEQLLLGLRERVACHGVSPVCQRVGEGNGSEQPVARGSRHAGGDVDGEKGVLAQRHLHALPGLEGEFTLAVQRHGASARGHRVRLAGGHAPPARHLHRPHHARRDRRVQRGRRRRRRGLLAALVTRWRQLHRQAAGLAPARPVAATHRWPTGRWIAGRQTRGRPRRVNWSSTARARRRCGRA